MSRISNICIAFILCLFLSNDVFSVAYTAPIINNSGQVGLFYTHSAMTMGMGRLNIALKGAYSGHTNFIKSITSDTGSGTWSDTLTSSRDTSDLDYFIPGIGIINMGASLGYGITHFMDFSVTLPMYIDAVSNEKYGINGGPRNSTIGGGGWGLGDLEVALKFQYPPYPHKRFFEMAYLGTVSIPTGNPNQGYFPRHTYYVHKDTTSTKVEGMFTSKSVELDMKMLWTIDVEKLSDLSPVQIHINYGVRWTLSQVLDHLFLLNLAFEYHPIDWLHLFTEFSGETRIENINKGFKIGDDPLRLTPGISITPPGGFHFTAGVDINLSGDTLVRYQNKGKMWATAIEPQWRLTGTIGWAGYILPQDADQDGIKDNKDRCPMNPEDLDGYEDLDGCPDNDNDNDGITDLKDKCPNDAEDMDGFNDEDGCPDYDNDNDLVADTVDKCPSVPEDIDEFEDEDGCPDYDNDNDGIPDSIDHCLSLPEDMDGFQDHDGCPDVDNDLDQVPDSVDSCPDVPGEVDNKGCPKDKPRAKEIKRGRVILRGVNFESGKDVLTNDSYQTLDRVYQSLVEWPEVKLEIRGHTDSVGSRFFNRRLSQKRADAVRSYLLSRGIDPNRLVAKGFGEDEPIADNATAIGRATNRRVELHRID